MIFLFFFFAFVLLFHSILYIFPLFGYLLILINLVIRIRVHIRRICNSKKIFYILITFLLLFFVRALGNSMRMGRTGSYHSILPGSLQKDVNTLHGVSFLKALSECLKKSKWRAAARWIRPLLQSGELCCRSAQTCR